MSTPKICNQLLTKQWPRKVDDPAYGPSTRWTRQSKQGQISRFDPMVAKVVAYGRNRDPPFEFAGYLPKCTIFRFRHTSHLEAFCHIGQDNDLYEMARRKPC